MIPEDVLSAEVDKLLKNDQEITQRDFIPYALCGVVVEFTESGARISGFS